MDLSEELDKWRLLRLVEGTTGGLLDVSATGLSGKVSGSSDGASEASEDEEPWLCWLRYLAKILSALFEENPEKKRRFALVQSPIL